MPFVLCKLRLQPKRNGRNFRDNVSPMFIIFHNKPELYENIEPYITDSIYYNAENISTNCM